ncbi:MAG: hypothetical protein ACK47B_15730 [Armatimonadota bacterium]
MRRRSTPPDYSAYRAAAGAAGVVWSEEARSSSPCRVFVRLDTHTQRLSVDLPPQVSLATAEPWLQETSEALGGSAVRLYSYQDAQRTVVTLVSPVHSVHPFSRRATVDTRLLEARLRKLTPNPVLLYVRSSNAGITSVAPAPSARATYGGDTFLFYAALPSGSGALSVIYGYSARETAAVLLALGLWLLFPVVVLLALRAHLRRQEDLTPEARAAAFKRWGWGIRIAAVVGTFFTFAVLGTARAGGLPLGGTSGLPPAVPLWFWCSAVAKLITLPEPSDRPRLAAWSRWCSALWDLALMGLLVAVWLAPIRSWVAPLVLRSGLQAIPLLVATAVAALGAGLAFFGLYLLRRAPAAWAASRAPSPIPSDPEGLREAFRELTAQAASEEIPATPEIPSTIPRGAADFINALEETVRTLEPDQRAALTASSRLLLEGRPPRIHGPLLSIFVTGAALAGTGVAVWLVPVPLQWVVLAGGVGLSFAGSIFGSWIANKSDGSLRQRQEEADFKVAQVMDDPHRLVDALRRLEECERVLGFRTASGAAVTSIHQDRRERLERRLGDGCCPTA